MAASWHDDNGGLRIFGPSSPAQSRPGPPPALPIQFLGKRLCDKRKLRAGPKSPAGVAGRQRALQWDIAMKSARRLIAGTLVLLDVAACSTQPWVLGKSPDAITLRWYPDETDVVAADQLAALHCRSGGKEARRESEILDGSAEIARYVCR